MSIQLHKVIAVCVLSLVVANAGAQTRQLTLEDCYRLARQNYPLIKKEALIAKSNRFSLENISRIYWPQASVSGQATYQSQTINFKEALPGLSVSFPNFSKDQYRIQGEVTQQIYDGGMGRNQRELADANEQIQQQSLEVNLNTLKSRVDQVYFSILLLNEQLKQNEVRKSDLQGALDKASAAFQNGTGFRSDIDELKATFVNTDMAAIELNANRKAYMDMLSLLIGQPVDESTAFVLPLPPPATADINRPELKQYDLQKKVFDIQERQLKSGYLPKLNAFIQGAYGRPTLNIVENKFGAWWIGGVRLNWPFGTLYTVKNNKGLLAISRQNLDIDKETFLFNTRLTLSQQNAEIKKYADLIQKDDTMIALRAAVVQSAKGQWDNGVITVHEYLSKLNEEDLARQGRIVHSILLLQAEYNFKNTSGN